MRLRQTLVVNLIDIRKFLLMASPTCLINHFESETTFRFFWFNLFWILSLFLILGNMTQLQQINTWVYSMMSSFVLISSLWLLWLMSLDYWVLLLRFCCIPEYVLDILQIGFTFTFSWSHVLSTTILSVGLLTFWLVQLSRRFLRLKAKLSLTIYFLCLMFGGHVNFGKIHVIHELVVVNCLIMLK